VITPRARNDVASIRLTIEATIEGDDALPLVTLLTAVRMVVAWQTPGVDSLEHVANAFCLEVANSVGNRYAPSTDWLASAEAYRTWVSSLGGSSSLPSERELRGLAALRESLYGVFHAIHLGSPPAVKDLRRVTVTAGRAIADSAIAPVGGRFDLEWRAPWDPLTIQGRAAISALDLLRSDQLDRLGECPTCGWLFVDTSKNGTRRWCSMGMCGARAKSAAYYRRKQAGVSSRT
jgi:predicted RNA-binding Zn ribbon-like protein